MFELTRQLRLPFPLLSDPERDTYRAYSLERGRISQILSPGTVWTYIKLLARGRIYQFRRSDMRQLGGDFVIDTEGVVRFSYRSAAPHDRPSVETLMAIVADL